MANLNLPPGFKFKPSDDALITYYLKPKVLGQQLPCSNVIKDDIQLYGSNSTPWDLFDINDSDSWIDHSVYVFTSLSKISSTAPVRSRSRFNTNKKAGCGTWKQKTPRKPIKDGFGNVIGGKRMLVFVINDVSVPVDPDKAVYFKMHEYSLWGVNEGLGGDDLVLCQISFDSSRRAIVKLASQKTDSTPKACKAQKKTENMKNLQGSVGSTKGVIVVNCDVGEEITSLSPEGLVGMDGRVGNGEGSMAAVDKNVVQGSDWFGGGLCKDGLRCDEPGLDSFDMDSFDVPELMQLLDSTAEEEILDDRAIHMPGKRKLEERDSSCQPKKLCF
ncbi:hypothetical protein DCAR_0624065 [Daucus carota subsp. sativus]|uniref:NAC domain-containing protein n=2 Tax=Daucus carota subsp. sativus TaxID=79200 RepID=A0AAF1B2Y1_DAUCS|nr:PREDICTED: NAC domain-containing protein 68-like [Daucus carota subsp. sativus]WOH04654.1 hypothetical protein DCAR_0624065 [Daucus carota subsp. sativus]